MFDETPGAVGISAGAILATWLAQERAVPLV